MTILRARVLNAQGAPVQGRTATLEPYTGNRYENPYPGGGNSIRTLTAVSDASGWLQWQLPDPQHRPGPRGLYWLIRGLEASPVVAATQPSDGTVTLPEKRVGTLSPDGEIIPVSTAPGGGAAPGAGVDPADVGFDVVLVLGQSNAQGTNTDSNPREDYADPRVLVHEPSGTYANRQVLAVEPLTHPGGTGTGPAGAFARSYVAAVPPNRRVLIVPAAHGGTAFTDAGGGTGNVWDADGTDTLLTRAITQARRALASHPRNRMAAVLWVQGESNAGMPQATYAAKLDALIARLRADLDDPDLPFVVGGMVPEYATASAPTVHEAHLATPARTLRTAFAHGPRGAHHDGLHYTAAGQRKLGTGMTEAFRALLAGTALLAPSAPAGLAVIPGGTSAAVSWSPVPGAYGYRVQSRPAGGDTWATVTAFQETTTATVSGLSTGTGYEVRVTAQAAGGDSEAAIQAFTTTGTATEEEEPAPTPDVSPFPLSSTRGTVSYGPGRFGSALQTGTIYGGSGVAELSAPVGTLEVWCRTTQAEGIRIATGADSTSFWLGVDWGRPAIGDGATIRTATEGGYADGNWHHLAVTMDGTNVRLWADGELVIEAANPSPFVIKGLWGAWAIGGYGENTSYEWEGGIDEVRVSSAVRYTAPFTPPSAPFTADGDTLALWHLNG